MLEFGASFRKSRESLNVSLEKIAAETRINSRFLEAIEAERFDLLPGGIFNRGFIRTYAIRLGLDPEEALQGYEKLLRAAESEPSHQEPGRPRGKTTKIPVYYVALAGLLVLVVVFYFLTRHSETPPVKLTAPTPVDEIEEVPAPSAEIPAPDTASIATELTVPTALPAVPVAALAPAPPPSAAAVVLELEVQEESWFKISSDGGEIVTSEVLAPGTVRRYTAASSMNISIGNAAGVSLRVNGQPVTSLGRNGQVRNLTITPNTSASSLNLR